MQCVCVCVCVVVESYVVYATYFSHYVRPPLFVASPRPPCRCCYYCDPSTSSTTWEHPEDVDAEGKLFKFRRKRFKLLIAVGAAGGGDSGAGEQTTTLCIDRKNLVLDTFRAFEKLTPEQLRERMKIEVCICVCVSCAYICLSNS